MATIVFLPCRSEKVQDVVAPMSTSAENAESARDSRRRELEEVARARGRIDWEKLRDEQEEERRREERRRELEEVAAAVKSGGAAAPFEAEAESGRRRLEEARGARAKELREVAEARSNISRAAAEVEGGSTVWDLEVAAAVAAEEANGVEEAEQEKKENFKSAAASWGQREKQQQQQQQQQQRPTTKRPAGPPPPAPKATATTTTTQSSSSSSSSHQRIGPPLLSGRDAAEWDEIESYMQQSQEAILRSVEEVG